MDAIVIISIDPDELVDSVKKARDAGIKVIAYDRPIPKADVDLYISFDNGKVGELMAEAFTAQRYPFSSHGCYQPWYVTYGR